jgi:hypothetical protein
MASLYENCRPELSLMAQFGVNCYLLFVIRI